MKAHSAQATGCLLLAACSSGGGHPNAARSSARPVVTTSTAAPSPPSFAVPTFTTPSPGAPNPWPATLADAPGPTPGTSLSLQQMPLAAGDGVSIGMHPSAAPITLRATASMPLAVCSDLDPDHGGLGGGWPPGHALKGCHRLTLGRWVQLPSSDTSTFHVAFRITAQRAGTISSLKVSYQRIDAFLIVEAATTTLRPMSVTFIPKGTTLAAGVAGVTAASGGHVAGEVTVDQAGSAKQHTGTCTFSTEAAVCFLGLTSGLPVTVRALHAPAKPWLLFDLELQ